jgi:N-acetylglucosamine-6-phosphate deacetylase
MKPSDFTLSGLTLLPEGTFSEVSVLVHQGIIARLEPGIDRQADVIVDGYLAPGFIDLQINGAYGYDFSVDGAGAAAVAARLPETGVTAFLPTVITSPFESYPERLREIAAAAQAGRGAQILGVHLEGPYLNPLRKGAHASTHLRSIDLAEILGWADPQWVRIVTLAPELPGALEAIKALSRAGILVSAGHSDATYAESWAGFQAGIGWGTHLFNAMRPLQQREPGLPGALLTADLPVGLIPDGIHLHPAVVRLAMAAKGCAGLTLVTDAMEAMGMPPGQYGLAGREVLVTEARAELLPGRTLAGSVLRMDGAVRNMQAFTGCSLAEAIQMASQTPARLLGLERKGRLAPGCDADLVVLDTNQQVKQTYVAGELVFG